MRNLLSISSIFFIALTVGCAIQTKERSSFLAVYSDEGDLQNRKIEIDEIKIFAYPMNTVTEWEIFYFTLIPVFFSLDDKIPPPPLWLKMGFLTQTYGYSFDPNSIALYVDGKGPFYPKGLLGLPQDEGTRRFHNAYKGYISCGSWFIGDEPTPIVQDRIQLAESDFWNCFILSFDIPPPDPSQNISLQIGDLQKDKNKFMIPRLGFKEVVYYNTDTAP